MSSEPDMYEMKAESEWQQIHEWINELPNPGLRVKALRELVRKRFDTPNLPILLCENTATTFVLLQEIIKPFSTMNPADMTKKQSYRICLTLKLLRIIAAHRETRLEFARTKYFLCLYPFLNITWSSEAFLKAKMLSLSILTSLVDSGDKEILTLLLSTDFIPLLLRVIGGGSGFSRNNAIITLHKILVNNDGLAYVVGKQEFVDHINLVLKRTLAKLRPSLVTVHIRLCFKRLHEKNN